MTRNDYIILPFKAEDLLDIEVQEEQKDQIFLGGLVFGTVLEYGKFLQYSNMPMAYELSPAYTAFEESTGKIIACWGGNMITPNTAELWLFFSGDTSFAKDIIREGRQFIRNIRTPRIQAFADIDFKRANNFLKLIGCEFEGLCRKSGVDLKDRNLYSFIRD